MKKKYLTDDERKAAHAEESRRYRASNPDKYKESIRKWREKNMDKVKEMSQRQYARNKSIIDKLRTNNNCYDCGNKDPRVLQFDHVPERGKKVYNITHNSLGINTRKKELDKCDIVCANCHAIRTYERRIAKDGYGN